VSDSTLVGRTYTTGRRQPYLIRKWPGSNWALPLGPYTITQMLVFVGSVYLLLTYRDVWAHFGGLNPVIAVGVPVGLTYATRHTRIEGRDPLRAGVALAGLLLRPPGGHVNGRPVRPARPVRLRPARFPVAQFPVAQFPVAQSPVVRSPAALVPAGDRDPARPGGRPWVADLVAEAARGAGTRR
jgi:hypothetical protein